MKNRLPIGSSLLMGLAALLLAGPLPAKADILGKFQSAGWQGFAYGDLAGDFAFCSIARAAPDGAELSFGIDRDMSWFMGVGRSDWALEPGTGLALAYAVDGASPQAVSAEVRSRQGLIVAFPDDQALIRRFQYGRDLAILANDAELRFDLAGARRAFEALLDCTRRWAGGGLGKNGNAFSSPVQPLDWSEAPDPARLALAAEARAIGQEWIGAASGTDYSPLTGNDLQDTLPGYDAGWVTNTAIAGLRIMPLYAAEAERLAASYTAADRLYCHGAFEAGGAERIEGGLLRFSDFCHDEAAKLAGHYMILPRPAGGYYVFLVMGRIDADGGDPAWRLAKTMAPILARMTVMP